MDENLTEEQQIELIKRIWKEYGFSAIAGIAIALTIGFGWRYYQTYVTRRADRASVVYERVINDLVTNQTADAAKQSHYLIQEYSATPYAKFAALLLAKQAVLQNKFDDAAKQLQWVIKHGSSDTFVQIARIRLGRIYLEQKTPSKAIDILEKVNSQAYLGLVLEVRGDAYLQLKQMDKARSSYQAALKQLPPTAINRSLLQMKLDDLPK